MGKKGQKSKRGQAETDWGEPKTIRITAVITQTAKDLLDSMVNSMNVSLTELLERFARGLPTSISDPVAKNEKLPPTANYECGDLAIVYIRALVNSGGMNAFDLQKLADELQVPSERLAKILKQAKGDITNGNHY